jgi:hypothetical protein
MTPVSRIAQVRDMTMQNEYNIRLKDVEMAERVRELTDGAAAEREADRFRFEGLLQDKADMEEAHTAQLKDLANRQQASRATSSMIMRHDLCQKRWTLHRNALATEVQPFLSLRDLHANGALFHTTFFRTCPDPRGS